MRLSFLTIVNYQDKKMKIFVKDLCDYIEERNMFSLFLKQLARYNTNENVVFINDTKCRDRPHPLLVDVLELSKTDEQQNTKTMYYHLKNRIIITKKTVVMGAVQVNFLF